jgi:hypothetical protein
MQTSAMPREAAPPGPRRGGLTRHETTWISPEKERKLGAKRGQLMDKKNHLKKPQKLS